MITITWSKSAKSMRIVNTIKGPWTARVSCVVRNEENGWRKLDEVVYTIPDRLPYQPRTFPTGVWKIGRPKRETDPYLAPYFIPTNAAQDVETWELTPEGAYHQPTGRMVRDSGYGLHFSTSNTTIGCIKIRERGCLIRLVSEIIETLAAGQECTIEVSE